MKSSLNDVVQKNVCDAGSDFQVFSFFYLKNYYFIIFFAGPFYPISRPTLALLLTKSNLLFTAIGTGYNILCYHGDGSFVK